MRIGNVPPTGEALKEGKWYFGFIFRKCPPHMIGLFKPYLLVCVMKVIDVGEYGKVNGRPPKRWGGYKVFVSPLGISIKLMWR